jgi:transcriptional regulator with XRE-family HTH domain
MRDKPEETTYPVRVNDAIRAVIRAHIQKTGLSQAEVARQMGLEPQELNRALQNRGKIPPVWATILNHFKLKLTAEPKQPEDV